MGAQLPETSIVHKKYINRLTCSILCLHSTFKTGREVSHETVGASECLYFVHMGFLHDPVEYLLPNIGAEIVRGIPLRQSSCCDVDYIRKVQRRGLMTSRLGSVDFRP